MAFASIENAITSFCQQRLALGWRKKAGLLPSKTLKHLFVTRRLRMVFEEARTDDDFERITDVYARGKKEIVFAGIKTKFDDPANPTYGALVQRRFAANDDPDLYVAVNDCRGGKLARRFFTRWHEIAHRFTTAGC